MTKQPEGTEMDRVIGANLRAARKKRGWSLTDVQEYTAGVFRASIMGAYERGERSIGTSRLVALCGVYGISASAILDTMVVEPVRCRMCGQIVPH